MTFTIKATKVYVNTGRCGAVDRSLVNCKSVGMTVFHGVSDHKADEFFAIRDRERKHLWVYCRHRALLRLLGTVIQVKHNFVQKILIRRCC